MWHIHNQKHAVVWNYMDEQRKALFHICSIGLVDNSDTKNVCVSLLTML